MVAVAAKPITFSVEGTTLEGVLHVAAAPTLGAAAVLHGFGGHPAQPHVVATCEALARSGIGALRFAFRDHRPPRMTLTRAVADTTAALDQLEGRGPLALVGFSFGGAVAALAAARDPRVRAVVLAAAPSQFRPSPEDEMLDPVAELSRSRADVLLIWGSRDTEVPFAHAERYRAGLSERAAPPEVVTVDGGDHDFAPDGPRAEMARAVARWTVERIRG